jgi:hypothetical protein
MANVFPLPGNNIARQRLNDRLLALQELVEAAEAVAANPAFRIAAEAGFCLPSWADRITTYRREFGRRLDAALSALEEVESLRYRLFEGLAELVPLDYCPRYKYEARLLLGQRKKH